MARIENQSRQTMSMLSIYQCYFVIMPIVISGCATPNLSLEEARKVSLAMGEKPFLKPPRRINDILAVLDQTGQFNADVTKKWKTTAAEVPLNGAKDD